MSADAPNQGMTAPRPQMLERIHGEENGHALWLETSPLMKLTHPCKCQCTSGKDHLLSPLPTAAELAAALAPDDGEKAAALERSLAQPLSAMEVDFEALVGPKRKLLQSSGPFWCGGCMVSICAPPVCGTPLPSLSCSASATRNARR